MLIREFGPRFQVRQAQPGRKSADKGFNGRYGPSMHMSPARRRVPAAPQQRREPGRLPLMIGTALRLIRDFFTVLFDMIYWLANNLLRLNRSAVRSLLPGQSRFVHTVVLYLVVGLEIVGLWVAAVAAAAKN
jgi:hypothetical protein